MPEDGEYYGKHGNCPLYFIASVSVEETSNGQKIVGLSLLSHEVGKWVLCGTEAEVSACQHC